MNRISAGVLRVCRPTSEILGRVRRSVLRPDCKRRVCLGALADNVSGFTLTVMPDGEIRLAPLVEIPRTAAP